MCEGGVPGRRGRYLHLDSRHLLSLSARRDEAIGSISDPVSSS